MNHFPQISFDVENLTFGFHNEKLGKGRNTVETCHITSVADPDVFGPPGSVNPYPLRGTDPVPQIILSSSKNSTDNKNLDSYCFTTSL
jgi:hypothetical protein